ncbi:GEVED domain-containing protein [Tenacibaculum sp. 190524A02b]|uniref:GEVED domain-containing protein n=1 Tax=Tenacibaculum vairaonense TaxID=3137860 RepID=UPI0031FB09A4
MTLLKKERLIRLLIVSSLALSSWVAKSQEFKKTTCGIDQAMDALHKAKPNSKLELFQLRQQTKSLLHNKSKAKSYVVPVVVHVFGNTFNGGSKVTLDIVKEALKLTNEDFQGLNADYTTIDAPFDAIKQPLDITFKLAQLDPDGNPTTGVVFYDKASGMGNYGSPIVKQVAWDNYKYCNIYITRDLYDDGDHYNSGVAWYPSKGMSDENIARIVYNGSYLGTNTNENFRSVFTHEFGHYLDLPHTFDKGVCNNDPNDGDGVADTPSQKNHSAGTQCNVIKNCLNQEINNENFMDYTDCYKMFTKGQVDRMVNALENSVTRNTLWTDENLIATGLSQDLGARVTASSNVFEERFLNDGAIEKSIEINCIDCNFTKSSGNYTLDTDYSIDNIPSGMTAKLEAVSNNKATLTLEGNATNHEATNSVSNLTLNFLNPMISGGASQLYNQNLKFKVNFKDTYTEYCNINIRYATYTHITKVDFNGVVNETAYEGTTDNTSKIKFKTKQGQTYPLSITTNKGKGGNGDNLRIQVWFDWNKDFIYDDSELVKTHSYGNAQADADGNYTYTTDITIPSDISLGDTAFRVLAHYVQGNEGDTACSTIDSGESEDYGITVLDQDTPFTVDFYGTPTDVNFSDEVNFSDTSVADNGDNINAWKWTFEGGTPSTSTERNPKGILFKEAGKYDVTLEVTTATGATKTLTKTDYITSKLLYCDSSPNFGTYFNVNKVQIATINHEPFKSNSYSYYDTVTTNLTVGQTYPITIKTEKGNGGNGDVNRVRVWADWNFDSQFSQDELMISREVKASDYNSNDEFEFTDNITVPNNAAIGKKVALRIIGHYVDGKGGETACGSYDSGNTSDYGINIVDGSGNESPKISTISSAVALEGTDLEHTVTLTNTTSKEETYPLSITDETATKGDDFGVATFSNGVTYNGVNIIVPANIASFKITIPTIDDSDVESNESYTIKSGSITASGVITDNDSDTNPSDYCTASTTRDDSYITKVTYGTVENSSEHEGYSDYSNMSDTFEPETTFTLTIETKMNTWTYNAVGAWIDWNDNKQFEESEKVFSAFRGGPYVADITVPKDAVTGKSLRMRIRKGYGSEDKITPCGEDSYFGEVEDYSIIVSSDTTPIEYCTASTVRDDSHITNVSFGNISNASEHQPYSDYTSMSDTFTIGETFTLNITTKNDHWTYNAIGAWIDWNNNGQFEETERVYKLYGAGPYSSDIAVPSNAITDKSLRMRVRMAYGSDYVEPCGEDNYFGEVEDYSILISGATAGISYPDNTFNQVSVYPIPSKDVLYLETSSPETMNIHILDIKGKTVYKTTKNPTSNKVNLSLKQLPNGIYFMRGTQKGKVSYKKIIIAK